MKKKRILLAISIVLVLYFLEYLYRWMQVPLLTDYFDNYMKNGLSLEQQEALKTIDTLKGAFILFPKDDDLVFQYSIMLDKMSKLEEQVAAFELLDNHKI